MDRVKEKVAFISGAAMGLGFAMARRLGQEGARVFISDIQEDALKKAAEDLSMDGIEIATVRQDVTREEDWEAAMEACLRHYGQLDIAVNNAGVSLSGNVEQTSLKDWRWLMAVNLDGVFLGTKHAIAAMRKSSRLGSIINISSIEGLIGDPNLAAYNASKGGVRIFTKSCALHCAKEGYGIRVNSIHPGYIWTPMVQHYVEETGEAENARAALAALHPLGHIGEPDDIAWGVVYLASDESKFVTGAELIIDGGYTAQ